MQPKRKSQRKKDYDYSQPGYYAVTICTQARSCLFGIIDNDDMQLNDAGRMVNNTWHEIQDHYPGVELDVMQIMPNHLHGMIVVSAVGTAPRGRPYPGKEKGHTPEQKAAKKKRREEYMTVFINGKQKRVKRPPTIDGMPVEEFIRRNADPIWLHQNEMWEYMDQNETQHDTFLDNEENPF